MSRKPRPLVLSEAESQQLAHIVESASDWRARQCARTLLLHSGQPINTVATEQGLSRDFERMPQVLAVRISANVTDHFGDRDR